MRQLKFFQSINEALSQSMSRNPKVLIMGLGVDDPKGIFGTTYGLKKKFGLKRVFDMPTAENSMTGVAIGASLSGFRPILTHQRVEFALLSMEQIINQAAKWYYMNAGQMSVPVVIRIIIGRGWGNGPQHTQSLESLFSNIPGLKVISPSNPKDAKGLLISSIEDKNPVIFFENRWLYETYGNVPKKYYKVPIGKCNILHKGRDITLVSNSYMALECLNASKILKQIGINAEVIDLRTLRPLDSKTIINSVKKTNKLLVIDNGWPQYGISSEIISLIAENFSKKKLNIKLHRLSIADVPIPSSRSLTEDCYPNPYLISKKICNILNIKKNKLKTLFKTENLHDVPNKNFRGPF